MPALFGFLALMTDLLRRPGHSRSFTPATHSLTNTARTETLQTLT